MTNFFDVEPLPGYHPEIGIMLSAMHDSTREWREELSWEEVPIEAIVWQPASHSYSIGALLLHLIDVEDFWFRRISGGQAPIPDEEVLLMSKEIDQDAGKWPAPPAQPLSWYYELHDRIRVRAFEAIKGIEPTRHYEPPGWGRSFTFRWIVAHTLEHDSYTGGQAVALHELWKKMRA